MSAASKVLGSPAIGLLRRRAMSLGAAKAFDSLVQFLLPVVLVRCLDTATFGEYRLLWLAVGTVIALATLNMPQSLYFYLPRSDAPTRRLFIHHTMIYLGVAGLIAAWAVSPWNPWMPETLRPLGKYGALVPAFVTLWVTAYMIDVMPIIEERIRLATAVTIGFSALRVLLLSAGALFAHDLGLLLWLLLAFVLLKLAAQLYYVHRFHSLRGAWLRPRELWEHFRHAAPFGLSSALYTMRVQGDQWVAATLFALHSFAALSVAAVFHPLVNVFRQSVNEAFLPSMSRSQAGGDLGDMLALNSRANLMVGTLLYPLLAFAFAFAGEIVTIIYTAAYLEAAAVMRVYIIGAACLVIELGSMVLLLQQGSFALRTNLVLLAGSVALSYLGALHVGLTGAAAGSVLAIYLDRVITLRRVSLKTGIPFSRLQNWRRLGLTVAVAAAAGALGWLAVEILLPHASSLRRLMLGAAAIGLAYLPWLVVNARSQEDAAE
jgi:O-antigen/teichoic acid export membrane protein